MRRYQAVLTALLFCTSCAHDRTVPAASPSPIVAANPSVGGAAMLADRTIIANAAAAPNLSTLVAAITAAGLVETLSAPGPFTVFAPSNEAFGRIAPGTVDTLLKPENKAALTKVLTYHVVTGTITTADLMQRIAASGTATLTSIEGDPLTLTMTGTAITLTDVGGNKSYIETGDVRQANGILHVVNGVLVPRLR